MNAPAVHSLKVWPRLFAQLVDGSKNFELRKNDRGFAVGDFLSLWEYCPTSKTYSGDNVSRRVRSMLENFAGLEPGYVVLGLELIDAAPAESVPIPMILHCPKCGLQHVDGPEGQFYPGHTAEESMAVNKVYREWDNPPHRSHLCHGCGHVWRPADVPTVGVDRIQTVGKNDSPLAEGVRP